MVAGPQSGLMGALEQWCQRETAVCSAVLFGSQARERNHTSAADSWSDIDLHIITSAATRIEKADWSHLLPDQHFCLQVARPATGGVRKLTVLFAEGEADLVLVPAAKFRLAALAMTLGLHRKFPRVRDPLNRLATIMSGGYRFLKGENRWGRFYSRIVAEMEGYRLDDDEVRRLAEVFLCDLLWVLQKLERGELIAAQRAIHASLIETNVQLLHEARLRRWQPTFQQARRLERIVSSAELATVRVSARHETDELRRAAWSAYDGLKILMGELLPHWKVSEGMVALLAPHSPRPT